MSYAGFWVTRPDQAARFSGSFAAAPSANVTPSTAKDVVHPSDRLHQAMRLDQSVFITQQQFRKPYKVTSFSNWFRDRCNEAGVPGSIHGLRKAGATRLANAGASEREIASYLAHTDATQARAYTRKANRAKLADSGFEKLREMSNSSDKLDNEGENPNEYQCFTGKSGSP